MVKMKMFKMFTVYLSLSLLLLGCTSTVNKDVSSTQSNSSQLKESPKATITKIVNTSASVSGSTMLNVAKGILKVHFIDVGQGASQLIIGPTGKTILIDAGNNNMEKLVVAYLKKEKIKKIDILIGTHPDADHIGGLDAVIDNFDIGKIYMPKVQSNTDTFKDVLVAIQKKKLKVSTAKSGLTMDWETGIIGYSNDRSSWFQIINESEVP
jgi:beta-lactamase superfamily II metal-dependent hydrolase